MLIAPVAGLVAGLIHVWSGPDHLAAMAPLVAGGRRGWSPGARWGLGHSAGVAVVGLTSLWLRDLLPLQMLSSWGERVVGLTLVAIGIWALRKAFKVHAHEHEHDGTRHLHIHVHHQHAPHGRSGAHQHSHAAFGIGVLHGVAGSSHFLGVLPILAFPTVLQAASYLAAFAAGTILSMATFSSVVGLVAARWTNGNTNAYRRLMGLCAASAMILGCFWLFQ